MNDKYAEYRDIFSLVDRDGGGTITNVEFHGLLRTLGMDLSQEEINTMISEIDQDNNGEIDFEEFTAMISRKVSIKYTSEEVARAFDLFCKDSPHGFIKADALFDALTLYGEEKLSENDAKQLISQLKADRVDMVHYSELIEAMLSD